MRSTSSMTICGTTKWSLTSNLCRMMSSPLSVLTIRQTPTKQLFLRSSLSSSFGLFFCLTHFLFKASHEVQEEMCLAIVVGYPITPNKDWYPQTCFSGTSQKAMLKAAQIDKINKYKTEKLY